MEIIVIIILIFLIVMLVFLYIRYVDIRRKHSLLSGYINGLEGIIKEMILEKAASIRSSEEREERIKDLELALKEGYGITTRVEVKEVKIDFSTDERIIIVHGIEKLIGEEKNIDMIKMYIALLDKCYDVFLEANEVDHVNEIRELHNKRTK